MGLPQLDSCCFVFDLKTGNIIMGCINAVLSFTLLVMMSVEAVTVDVEKAQFKDLDDIEMKAGLTGLYVMSVILLLMFLGKFCFDVIFVYGVIAERPGIIKAYFIMWIVFFILSLSIFFLNVWHFDAGTICTELFYIGMNVYMILLSHSFYKQLNFREDV